MYRKIDWDAITIKNNFLFQETLRNKSLCKQLLERVLHIQVKTIRYMETEKTMKAQLSSKNTRLDVYVEDNDDWRLKAMTLDMEIQDMKKRIAKREREKAKKEKTIEIAKKMLVAGEDIDKIVLFTDLTKDEVSALA